jgi:hypothetical protein
LDERYDDDDDDDGWRQRGVYLRLGHCTSLEATFQSLKEANAKSHQYTTSMELKFILGDPSSAAIYTAEEGEILCQSSIFPTTGWHLCSEVVNAEAVSKLYTTEVIIQTRDIALNSLRGSCGHPQVNARRNYLHKGALPASI